MPAIGKSWGKTMGNILSLWAIPQCCSLYRDRVCDFCLEIMRHCPFRDRFV
jgi:hypothetical protein